MNIEKQKYINLLYNYIQYSGLDIQKDNQMRCPNSAAHTNNDNNFSAHYYNNNRGGKPVVKCFSCGFIGDIYDVYGIINNDREFIDQYKGIDKIFGSGEFEKEIEENEKRFALSGNKSSADLEPVKYKSVPKKYAEVVFSRKNVDRCRSFSKFEIIKDGKITGHWFYTDCNNDVIAIDVRFEFIVLQKDGNFKKQKTVQTFWYNGSEIKSYGKINIIYNLYEALNSTKPIIIHEGAKCARIGINKLTSFCSVAYNRGVENADKPDWSVLENKTVYILNDNDDPGLKAARMIKEKLPHAVILDGIYQHFGNGLEDLKGADIENLIDAGIFVEEIEQYIFNSDVLGL